MLTILPATLTVKANDASKVYGDANPALSYTLSGFKYLDDPSVVTGTIAVTTAATTTSKVGNYDITTSGGPATNYTLNYVKGTLRITPASLYVKADDKVIMPAITL